MEIKGILEKIRQKENSQAEPFFALQIDNERVKSAIWAVEDGQAKVLAIGETQEWENGEDQPTDRKELLTAVDASLSSAAEKFSPEKKASEPNRVIFGLQADWVNQDKILPEKIRILKNLSDKLELSPVGFVVISEAVVHHLKTSEGIPPTAIVVGLGKKRLRLILVKLGKILKNLSVKRSGWLGDDLAEGFSQFEITEPFPTRILLYDGDEELETTRQQLVNYNWQEKRVNFLHLPKVEILTADFDIRAVVLSGGQEVAKVKGIKEKAESEEIKPEARSVVASMVKPEMMGFTRNKDITQGKPPMETVKKEKPAKSVLAIKEKAVKKIDFSKLTDFLARIKSGFSKRTSLITGLVVTFLLAVAGILIGFYWYLSRAEVTLLVTPQVLEKDFVVRFGPELSIVENEELSLPAEKVTAIVKGEKAAGTTGTKIIGEVAKGEVKIYNGTASEKTFEAGTILTSTTGIEFVLDEMVSIASQSGTAAEPIPGEAIISLTAREIGTEGNLTSGTEFNVAQYAKSDYVAKNKSAFTGGTSREVQVVAQKDFDELVANLKREMESRALDELLPQVSPGQKLIEESLTAQEVNKSFDKKVEEEATEVKLKLELKFSALSFSEEKLETLVGEEIQAAVPEGFEYQPEKSQTSFHLQNLAQAGAAVFTVHFKVNLLPKLEIETIKKNLSGKRQAIGLDYLEKLSNVDSFKVKIVPKLPDRLSTFPRLIKNIKIEMRTP